MTVEQGWLTLLLLALVAGISLSLLGFETVLLSREQGLRKAVGFVTGIVLFRLVYFLVMGLGFPGLINRLMTMRGNDSMGILDLVRQFSRGVMSGQHLIFDGLLVLAGIYLCMRALTNIGRRNEGAETTDDDPPTADKNKDRGMLGLLVLGFSWMAISINQWIFMAAGIAEIAKLSEFIHIRLILALAFIVIASLLLILPILFFALRPETAQNTLDRMTRGVGRAKPYIVTGLFLILGLYFLITGSFGLLRYFGAV